jgi:SAM-dependent methyltransferase
MLRTPPQLAPQVGKSNESNRFAWVEQALADIPAGWRLLDAGAGEQRYRPACRHLDYVSQDFARYDGGGDGAGLQTGAWDQTRLDIVSDITAVPEPDRSFDAVLCVEVFEHIPDPVAALREFARLLRSGGRLVLTAPFCSFTHFAPYHFASGLSRYWYEFYLPINGFEVRSIKANGNYFEFLAQETRRLRSIAQRYSGGVLDDEERTAIGTVLNALERFSRDDRGSSELLCFGFHVIAQRL